MSGKYANRFTSSYGKTSVKYWSDKYWKWNKKTETPYWCRCFFNNILTVLHKKAHLTVSVNKKQLFECTGKCNQQTQTSQKWFPEVSKIPVFVVLSDCSPVKFRNIGHWRCKNENGERRLNQSNAAAFFGRRRRLGSMHIFYVLEFVLSPLNLLLYVPRKLRRHQWSKNDWLSIPLHCGSNSCNNASKK